jgi:diacylglycerol kinase (ATP)
MNDVTIKEKATPRPFEFNGRIRSFRYAVLGIGRMIGCQHNAWVHAVATAVAIGAGVIFKITAREWCWIVLTIALVWTAEALNTAFEFLADAALPNFHPLVRNAKDVAAGAVLITAVAASVIGGIIFWPHLVMLFQ